MGWEVEFHHEFEAEFDELFQEAQDAILAKAKLLELIGPDLKRPHADALKNSRHINMKELRCRTSNGVWRVAFAFDPDRKAILLIAGDKAGVAEKRFYKRLISKADQRFDQHLAGLKRRR